MSRARSTAIAALAGFLAPPALLLLSWSLRGGPLSPPVEVPPPLDLDLGPPPGSERGPGVLLGRVLDAEGAPLEGAEVRASTGAYSGASRTDAEGRFVLEGTPLEPLSLRALAPHHVGVGIEGAAANGPPVEIVLAPRPPIRPPPGPDPPPPAGTLGGRCARTDGGPLGSFRVLAVPLDADGRETVPVAAATLDSRGFFDLPPLPPGPIHLLVVAGSRQDELRLRLATSRAEVVSGEAALVDLPFAAGAVAGVVRDAAGSPVDGAVVRFAVRRGEEDEIDAGIVRTGPDGAFRIGDLPGCTLEVEAIAPRLRAGRLVVETALGATREVVLEVE